MNKLIAASVMAVLCHVGTATAGVPAWCKDMSGETKYDLKDLSSPDPRIAVSAIARVTCKPSAEASAAMSQIDAARQAWGKKLGMVDADWADAIALSQADLGVGEVPNPELEVAGKDYANASALDQYVTIRKHLQRNGLLDIGTGMYAADMFDPNLTEVGRFAIVQACVNYERDQQDAPVIFAMCQADVDAFDRNKFVTQLRADTHSNGAAYKMHLRLRLYGLTKRFAAHADDVKSILAKDEQYKKLWDGATKGRAAFAAAKIDPSIVALALKLESAATFQSRKMFEGCEAATEAALEKVISERVSGSMFKDAPRDVPRDKDDYMHPGRIPPPSFGETAGPILADIPELLYVMNPYVQCHKDNNTTSKFLRGLLKYSPQLRGPRRAALAGMLREKIVLDDMNAKIVYPESRQPYDTNNPTTETRGGIVNKVTEDSNNPDDVKIEFDSKTTKGEDCVKSHYTNKVTRVNSNGSLSYELICDKFEIVNWDNTPDPMRVDKVYKPLLKKGVQFSQSNGAVVAIWPTKAAKVPSHILGVAVKP